MQDEQEILSGSVTAVVFQNRENGYAVVRLLCDDGSLVNVVGTIPMTTVGERLVVAGRWSHHPSYGRQFEAEFLERLMPEAADDILVYLSSRALRGVGAVTARRQKQDI